MKTLWTLVATAALLVVSCTSIGTTTPDRIFSLHDPEGDDHGDGSLLYPLEGEIATGDLDLVGLDARAVPGGTEFEVTFARNVRVPERRAIDAVGTPLDAVARHGFYTTNVDIYVDQNRQAGSGRTGMLPGRHARVSDDAAWERVISLTPRPAEAERVLRAVLTKTSIDRLKQEAKELTPADIAAMKASIPALVDTHVFFPTRIDVSGRSIRFFVPDSFLGGPTRATWAYTVVVTGADVNVSTDVVERLVPRAGVESVMVVPIETGRPRTAFGGRRDDDLAQPPIVDVLHPLAGAQEKALADYDPRGGRDAVVPSVVPAEAHRK